MNGFWGQLKKPIFALAPMANVTDESFRRIIAKYSKPAGPDIFWTEFVSCEGLLSEGRKKLLMDFWYSESERPIVAQIFGAKPEQFYQIAQLCRELKFDGIDINMGCPDKGLIKGGSCAALIKDPKLAKKIIAETKRGAGALPVSVKTRIGFNKIELDEWLPHLLESEPAAITLHLRTKKEMSAVPAHWELAGKAVGLRDRVGSQTLMLANGDVKDIAEARKLATDNGLDGIMLGRAIFGNPWLFSEHIPTTEEKLRVAVEHTKLFDALYGPARHSERSEESNSIRSFGVPQDDIEWLKPFDVMKKHFKAYVSGFDGAKELRAKMMEAEGVEEVQALVDEFL